MNTEHDDTFYDDECQEVYVHNHVDESHQIYRQNCEMMGIRGRRKVEPEPEPKTWTTTSNTEEVRMLAMDMAANSYMFATTDRLIRQKRQDCLIENTITAGNIVGWIGGSHSYKTFSLISLATHVAAGREWCGLKVKQGPVVYVAAEDYDGMPARVEAAMHHYGIPQSVPLLFKCGAINLFGQDDTFEFITGLRRLERTERKETDIGDKRVVHKIIYKFEPSLIIIDTLSPCMVGADENSGKDMGIVVSNIKKIRDAFDCTVIFAHHTGYSGTHARGSSKLLCDVDAEFYIARTKTGVTIKNRKNKSLPSNYTVASMRPVPVLNSVAMEYGGVKDSEPAEESKDVVEEYISNVLLSDMIDDDVPLVSSDGTEFTFKRADVLKFAADKLCEITGRSEKDWQYVARRKKAERVVLDCIDAGQMRWGDASKKTVTMILPACDSAD